MKHGFIYIYINELDYKLRNFRLYDSDLLYKLCQDFVCEDILLIMVSTYAFVGIKFKNKTY